MSNIPVDWIVSADGTVTSVVIGGDTYTGAASDNLATALTDNATEWAITTNYLPIRFSVAETDKYLEFASESGKTGKAVVSAITAQYGATRVGNDLYTSPVFRGSGEAREQMNTVVSDCLGKADGDFDIDAIFQTAYSNTLKKM